MNIQIYTNELDYVNAQLHLRGESDQSFLGTFCLACLRADAENYEFLRPTLHRLMVKYPAPEDRLAMECRDRGAEANAG